MGKIKNRWSVIIIGGGQAGLAAGFFLKQKKSDFIILDENEQVGDSWKKRWDSLHLFTPSQYDGLPGMKFPLRKNSFPGKDEMADYLAEYTAKFRLPVHSSVRVKKISYSEGAYKLDTSNGTYFAEKIIVSSGTHPVPKIPAFASQLSSEIEQIHSSEYKNPDMLANGDVLVVGAGTSGVEIALEVSKERKTYISGKPTFHIPDRVFKYAGNLYWWVVKNMLTVKTPIGRKVKVKVLHGGGPLINISVEDLEKAGVTRLQRMKGVENGLPVMEDGTIVKVKTVIWCTGYKPDFSWVNLDILNETGWPDTERGVARKQKGLYFMGMPFQFGLASGLVGGVGRDAKYVVGKLIR
jgi:putative flavoprotein involved in K+ transport